MSRDILLSQIDPNPNQPRKHFDETSLNELAESIKANGLAVPILVRPNGDRFEIVHGERRFKAIRSLGWDTIPAEVRDLSPDDAQWLALVENIQRNDLSPIEEAKAYQSRLDEGMTQTELGQRIGKTQSYIAQKLRLLKLPDEVQQSLDVGDISEGHARQLLRLKNAEVQKEIAVKIVADGWTVTTTRVEVGAQHYIKDKVGTFRELIDFEKFTQQNHGVEPKNYHNIYAQISLGHFLNVAQGWWEHDNIPWFAHHALENFTLSELEQWEEFDNSLKQEGTDGLRFCLDLVYAPDDEIGKFVDDCNTNGVLITAQKSAEHFRQYRQKWDN